MNFDQCLNSLLLGRGLSRQTAAHSFKQVFSEAVGLNKVKSLLLLIAQKGESAEELSGCLDALQRLEQRTAVVGDEVMDTCGTGGDHSNSLNISTLAAFVIAGAGGKVAKHGNRGISSPCGSSDLLEALGVRLDSGPEKMLLSLRENGIAYFHAPYYHPVFSKMQPIRKLLRVRTLFNLIGPLANPLQVKSQLIGVAKKQFLPLFAETLRERGVQRAMVCHSRDGMDEISIHADTDAAWIEGHVIRALVIRPKTFFRKPLKRLPAIRSLQEKIRISLAILNNEIAGEMRYLICINAAAGLLVSGIADSLGEGIERAEESLLSGRAARALQGLITTSGGAPA